MLVKDGEVIDQKAATAIEKELGKEDDLIKVRPYLSEEVEYISPEYDEKYIVADISIPLDEHKNIMSKRVP